MQAKRVAGVAVVCLLVAASTVSLASATPSAARQLIAIEGKFNPMTGETTFVLNALGAGAELQRDAGRGRVTGAAKPSVLKKNGQRVTRITGSRALTGKQGSFELTELVESYPVTTSGFSSDHGTWTLKGVGGQYAGYIGGGGLAAVGTPNGAVLFRMEGYVSKR
jgi:hypothetical protein